MAIDFFNPPSMEEIISRLKTYIKSELSELNPTDQNSVIFSLMVAMANLSNDNNMQLLLDILPNIFPQYCKNVESLMNHAEIKNVERQPATGSKGKATIQGNVGAVIPLGTSFIANGNEYKTDSTVEIRSYAILVSKIDVNGTLVTVTTVSNHNFASNNVIDISGCEIEELNGSYEITVTGLDKFTYQINDTIVGEETSEDIVASCDLAVLNLNCTTTGINTNLFNGDSLSITEQISGVNPSAHTQYSAIAGGSDIQPFEEWKNVVVERYKNPITYFNENNIKETALSVTGVTKVWVYPITPDVGSVTVYFIRGNDENVIPDISEVKEVEEKVKALRTVKDDPADIYIYAPTPKTIDFTFSKIVPNSPTMKTAIINSLKELFEDNVELSTNLTKLEYNNAIGNSYDMETGTKLKSYVLETPVDDIEVELGELPILGTVTFL